MHNIRYKSGSLPAEIMDYSPPAGESQVGFDPTVCRLEGNRVSNYATKTLIITKYIGFRFKEDIII